MDARIFREYEIRGVADRDLAEVPRAAFVGEVTCSQAMDDELRGLIDSHLAAARRVTA